MTGPGDSLGRYTIDQVLETSRGAALYRAHDPAGAEVFIDAIHHPPAGWSALTLRQDLEPLHHASLPRMIEAFVVGSSQYLVFAYVCGRRMVDRLRDGTPPEPNAAARYAAALCDVLEYLHRQQPPRWHGELRPANLWLADDGGLLLFDVGVPRRVTTVYHAPEGSLDARSDVYALAATLYHVLTGRPPPMASQRAGGEPLDRDRIPEPWRAAIDAGLALRPDDRPADVAAFRKLLPRAAGKATIVLPDEPTKPSLDSTRRIKRPNVAPLVVLLGVLGVMLAFALSQALAPAVDHGWVEVPASAGVAAFRIARTEVTNAQYAACLAARGCTRPYDATRIDDPAYAGWPVVYVTIRQAREYAAWAGGRLPGEAEWQQACASDGQPQPWGAMLPDASRATLDAADAGAVGRLPGGASREGAYDLVGNVWEWVDAGGDDVVRGGGFDTPGVTAGCASRQAHRIAVRQQNIGFRIVADDRARLPWWGAAAALGVALVAALVAIVRTLRAPAHHAVTS